MYAVDLLRVVFDLKTAVHEVHEQVEFVAAAVVPRDPGIRSPSKVEEELGRLIDDSGYDVQVVD